MALSPRSSLGPSWRACPDKPVFHLLPRAGWVNDPNGLAWHGGELHVFYQHISDSAEWGWRMEWGHWSSSSGATFKHHPVVMSPSQGGPDACGCWSGCCVPAAADGSHPAVILYTGVRRRGLRGGGGGAPVAPHTAAGDDDWQPPTNGERHVDEVVCAAVAGGGDLEEWTKQEELVIARVPPQPRDGDGGGGGGGDGDADGEPWIGWSGFRDPFVFQHRTPTTPWRLVLGSGLANGRGEVLVYESDAPSPATPAWRFAGQLTTGVSRPLPTARPDDPTHGLSFMWECPLFVQVPVFDDGGDARDGGEPSAETGSRTWRPPPRAPADAHAPPDWPWLLIVSPLMVPGPSRAVPIAWVAASLTAEGRVPLDAETTSGPHAIDLASHGLLYATTGAVPPAGAPDGRPLTLAWLQEEGSGRVGAPDYAGCLTLPRRVWCVRSDASTLHLRQAPDPALAQLRVQPGTATSVLTVRDTPTSLPGAVGVALDVRATLTRGTAPTSCILLEGCVPPCALVADWDKGELRLDWSSDAPTPASTVRSQGGPCPDVAAGRLRLRLLIDHSVVEAYTGCGNTLTGRAYRGARPVSVRLLLGGEGAVATDVHVWTMRSCWAE